ncbi:TetR/AcrR family transcriptional regulator [Dysgonomonas termitidis]|uniref:TetR/AcrR family transcriptional regulator n=1 Tax=Dysgonomonas termitidis TaxID=1516126 RepID=A0ABV9KXT0_9BACT
MERDRDMTEEKLIKAVGELIVKEGFESLGVRKVAEQAGVNKTLIYRYFKSLDGIIYAYMKKHDFWLNTPLKQPDVSDIKGYLKTFYRREIAEYRDNIALKRLKRWELSSDKDFVVEIRAQREKNGVQFMEMMSGFSKVDKEQLQAITALMDAGIAYLAMLEENCQMYNGIDIQSDDGWKQIAKGIDSLIDIITK